MTRRPPRLGGTGRPSLLRPTLINVAAMFKSLIDSAREIRSPLVLGYSALFSLWLVVGEPWGERVAGSDLGGRLEDLFTGMGSTGQVALVTFAASMLGSLLWNGGTRALVAWLQKVLGHPNWDEWVARARRNLVDYETYNVTTVKGTSGGRMSTRDAVHTVPSPGRSAELADEVADRTRRAGEASFRVTLAIATVPIAVCAGVSGGGWWWMALIIPTLLWADVTLMKHTTELALIQFEIDDLTHLIGAVEQDIAQLRGVGDNSDDHIEAKARQIAQRTAEKADVEGRVAELEERRMRTRFAALSKLTGGG